jgi:long-chain fatty acid transport protein
MTKKLFAVLAIIVCLPLYAGGFELDEQSARAAGMGGAVVATVSDPSAIWYNPGGLALFKKRKGAAIGISTFKFNESLYQGLPPGIGVGTASKQTTKTNKIPHLFISLPLGASGVLGVGTYSPFRMNTEWSDPSTFAGRFLSTKSSIEALDVAPTAAFALSPNLGVGVGGIYRTSKISSTRRIGATLSGTLRDVGTLDMKTDSERGYGWSAGILGKVGEAFSWGASYRSAIKTDYVGAAHLTQIATGDAQFDQLIGASFPFGKDVALASHLDFPSQATFGIAVNAGKPLLFEVDVARTSWKKLQTIDFSFPSNATLNTTNAMRFKDTTSIRGGIRLAMPTGPQFRLGYRIEKSPQPPETVGAFFPDADRRVVTAGFGLDWLDLAIAWTRYDQRIVTTNVNQLNGNWRANSWLVAVTATK